jgi:predicted protein tyrosine phosphatase
MIVLVAPNLYVGSLEACPRHSPWHVATVHAAKHPCFRRAVGQPEPGHPNYLAYESGTDLFLNMIDADDPRFFSIELFDHACNFIQKWISQLPVLVHCNYGMSRSPAIALVYITRTRQKQPDPASYEDNNKWFLGVYKYYNPSSGIATFLKDNWEMLVHGDSASS